MRTKPAVETVVAQVPTKLSSHGYKLSIVDHFPLLSLSKDNEAFSSLGIKTRYLKEVEFSLR